MGRFEPGHPKLGGRQKGTPNKNQDLFAIVEKHGVNIFEEMLTMALTATDFDRRFNALKEIAQYLYPKRKALEVSADVDIELAKKAEEYSNLTKEQQIEMMESELKRLKGE